jgi:hypothetical protein
MDSDMIIKENCEAVCPICKRIMVVCFLEADLIHKDRWWAKCYHCQIRTFDFEELAILLRHVNKL